ncbi:hypothetical protein LJR030_004654 [Rhizobium sp. LjRoot30]|uniref:hypothetical protein n=1 Tax=Rhizobium sp. LjRoot30 TaxID=3342320 RepID=UPI003ECCBBA2
MRARTARLRRALISPAPLAPSFLVFLFAIFSFTLGNVQVIHSAARAGSTGTERTTQGSQVATRDANRLVLVAERKDLPQTGWNGDEPILPPGQVLLYLLPGKAAEGIVAVSPARLHPDPHGFLPRGPPTIA